MRKSLPDLSGRAQIKIHFGNFNVRKNVPQKVRLINLAAGTSPY